MPSRGHPDTVTSREMMPYSNDYLYLKVHTGIDLPSKKPGYQAFRVFIDAAFFAFSKLVSFQTNANLSCFDLVPQQNKILERATKIFHNCEVFDLELCEGDSSLLNILSSTLKLKKLRRNELQYSDSGSLCFFKIIEADCIWLCLKRAGDQRSFYI